MRTRAWLPNVLTYVDYRLYLADLYQALHRRDPGISLRHFARMAGSSSPNFLQLIRDRKLNIHEKSIDVVAKAIKLPRKHLSYLRTIVSFDHARSHDEKDRYFRRMVSTREYGAIRQLDRDQYELFSHWYVPVIRELVTADTYDDKPAWIAARLVPRISIAKVKQSIELLIRLRLIERDNDRWRQTATAVSTTSEVTAVAIARYHRDLLGLATESIDRFAPDQRDIRAVTIGLSRDGMVELKKRMEAFWKELLAFAATQSQVERVVQVNSQMFPLSTDDKASQP